MEDGTDRAIELKLAYWREDGQPVAQRLAHPSQVELQLLRGRFTFRHAHLCVKLRGAEEAIRETIRTFQDRAVTVRIPRDVK